MHHPTLLHDLRNVLERALACATWIQEEGGPEVREAASCIEQACFRAGEMVERIAGRASARERIVDLHAIAREVAALFSTDEGTGQGKSSFEVALSLCASRSRVRGDPADLFRMLLNLAANAREAMPDGGRMEFASREIQSGGKTWLELSLIDSGKGIAPGDLPYLFHPSFSTRGSGRGSGLWIAATIARAHGGSIEAGSRPGEGAHFRVTIPPAREFRIELEGADGAALRTQRELLRSLGHEVQRHPFERADLVVLDDEPPRFSAAHALKRLRGSGVPVVIVSAAPSSRFSELSGVRTRFVRKPCALGELERAIAELF